MPNLVKEITQQNIFKKIIQYLKRISITLSIKLKEKKRKLFFGELAVEGLIILMIKSILDDFKKLVIVDSDQRKVNHYIPSTEIIIKDVSELQKMENGSKIIITTALGLESIKKEIYAKFGNKFSINFVSSNKVIEIK